MAGFYERRRSRAAIWCLRLAVTAVPFFILTIFLHRSASITTHQAFWLIAFGIGMILASLVFGLRAATDLWEKGYKGGKATVNGIVLSVVLLIPFGVQLFNALENPQLNDVATDVINPPRFLEQLRGEDITGAQEIYDDFISREIVSNYPELVARRYNATQERVAEGVLEVLARWNWRVTKSQNLPEIAAGPDDGDVAEQSDNEEELAGSEEELAAAAGNSEGESMPDIIIQAQARSFIMKLQSDLVIRLSETGDGTLVDMRSASDWGRHDFGSNAKNISQFLTALDENLAGLAGEV